MTNFGFQPRRAASAFCAFAIALSAFATSTAQAATNTAPTISGTPPTVAVVGQRYAFQPTASDANGDTLKFSILNKPSWMWFSTSTGKLSGSPGSGQIGKTFTGITIRVSDGYVTKSLPSFWIRVSSTNPPPKISGTPKTSVTIGQNYFFRPTASDPNGDPLKFSIANKPGWLSFSTAKGSVSGVPGAAGTFSNIVISVSDGHSTTKLAPFSITVTSTSTGNHAPVISGTPVTVAKVGQPYAFKATASDVDNDTLKFSISGKPGWASFDVTTGTLSGTPTSANLGTFSNIVISVSDGKASDSLAPYSLTVTNTTSGSVTLNWSAPVSNTDGSALTNLSGYKVFYGTASRTYSKTLTLSGAGSTSVVISGLTSGTWYFAIKSYNTSGVYSAYSGEVVVKL
jgi:hypothetical protein